jgi:hypothetical protein
MAEGDDLGFLIEVEAGDGSVEAQSGGGKVIVATKTLLKDVGAVIDESCTALIEKVRTMDSKPDELTVEFGVDARGEAGVPLVTKGSLGAQFKVSVKWKLAE